MASAVRTLQQCHSNVLSTIALVQRQHKGFALNKDVISFFKYKMRCLDDTELQVLVSKDLSTSSK